MLLIGSRAAQFHWADFRQPDDWDFICHESELPYLEEIPGIKLLAKDQRSRKFKYKVGDLVLEIEVAERIPSSMRVLDYEKCNQDKYVIKELNRTVSVASPETLYLLKRSHIPFKIHWKKNFFDHAFIKERVKHLSLGLLATLDLRLEETKKRLAYKEHNFKVSNEKFFRDNIKRLIPHDNLHQMIKFYDRPMFEYIKQDTSKAEIDYQLFSMLPYEKQLANMAEEVMALSLERVILPAVVSGQRYSEYGTKCKLTSELCCNYLPFEFRFFAVDNFFQIVNFIPKDFAKPVIEALQKEIKEAQDVLPR